MFLPARRPIRAAGPGVKAWIAIGLVMVTLAFKGRSQTDGGLRWPFTVQGFVLSSPAVGPDGTVYVGVRTRTAGRVLAITSEGSPKWQFVAPDFVDSSPVVAPDGTVYVGCLDGKLYALTAAGVKKWEFDTQAFVYSSPALGADGTVYFGAGDSALHAVAPNGIERWKYSTGDWVDSSPAVGSDGTIYFGSWDKSIYAVTAAGAAKWRVGTGGAVLSSPALGADGTVYIGSMDQRLYAIAADGTKKWEFFTNGQIETSPAIGADGTIYFNSSDLNFYALNPDGSERWRRALGTTGISSPAVRGDGVIIFGADDGRVRALNPDGSSKWTYDTNSSTNTDTAIESSPVVAADGSVYVGSIDGKLYALNGSGSPVSGYSSWAMFHRDAAHSGRMVPSRDGGRLLNLSTRARAGNGTNLISGFVIQGAAEKYFLVRAVGPTLAQFGVAGTLADPTLTIKVPPAGLTLFANDNWNENTLGPSIVDTAAAVGAFPLPAGSKDAAVLALLPPGLYTALVGSADGNSGVALIEAYDAIAGDPDARLINLSTRGLVGTGANILIPGIVVGGTGRLRLLVRAVGPGLVQFGVPGVLARPTLAVYSGQTLSRTNTGWTSDGLKADLESAARAVGAFPLADGSADCAALLSVNPGNYTLQVSGVGGTTGEVLVEVYVTP